MKPRNVYRIVIGTLFILSGGALIVTNPGDAILPTALLAAGCAFLVTGIIRNKRYGDDPESDERSRKIGAYGLSYAWLTGIIGITLLFWADYFGIVKMSAQNAFAVSVLLLAFSAIIYQMYLFRKGDVG